MRGHHRHGDNLRTGGDITGMMTIWGQEGTSQAWSQSRDRRGHNRHEDNLGTGGDITGIKTIWGQEGA